MLLNLVPFQSHIFDAFDFFSKFVFFGNFYIFSIDIYLCKEEARLDRTKCPVKVEKKFSQQKT